MKELFYDKKDILSENIFQFVEEQFENHKSFLEFHQFDSWDVFEDVLEEMAENRLRIACELLEHYEVNYKTEQIEILDYIELRENYKNELTKLLGVSVKEGERIIELIRKRIMGTG